MPETNRAVWDQLKKGTKKAQTIVQRCQNFFFMTAAYATLEALSGACGPFKAILVHALVDFVRK